MFSHENAACYEKMKHSQQSSPKRNFHSLMCVTSLCVVVVTLVAVGTFFVSQMHSQIAELKTEVEENRKETKRILEHYDNNLEQKDFRNDSSFGFPSNRIRRQASPNLVGAHLVGKQILGGGNGTHREKHVQIPPENTFFLWSTVGDLCIDNLAVVVLDEATGTFLSILNSGYYFVYAQVTYYQRRHRANIGHEVVRKEGGSTEEVVLMRHVNKQVFQSKKNRREDNENMVADSGYQGGMFYLQMGDKIGVRSANPHQPHRFYMDEIKSFFGIFLLKEQLD